MALLTLSKRVVNYLPYSKTVTWRYVAPKRRRHSWRFNCYFKSKWSKHRSEESDITTSCRYVIVAVDYFLRPTDCQPPAWFKLCLNVFLWYFNVCFFKVALNLCDITEVPPTYPQKSMCFGTNHFLYISHTNKWKLDLSIFFYLCHFS